MEILKYLPWWLPSINRFSPRDRLETCTFTMVYKFGGRGGRYKWPDDVRLSKTATWSTAKSKSRRIGERQTRDRKTMWKTHCMCRWFINKKTNRKKLPYCDYTEEKKNEKKKKLTTRYSTSTEKKKKNPSVTATRGFDANRL